jgi:rod shape-determining protein MreC
MRRLLNILLQFREYFLLLLLLLISLVLLASNDATQIRTIRSLTVASVGYLQEVFGFIPNYFELKQENNILRELNLTQGEELSRLREAGLENTRLRQLLELKERSPLQYRVANVVGKSLHLLRNTITIDIGGQDGVRVNMPIVSEAGLVGRVVAVGSHYALGQIVLNKEFRASAKVQRSRVDGILIWEGGPFVQLKNVAKTLDVKVGDVVVTSEYSSVFPAGIKIGVVSSTSQSPGALFQTVEITPGVDFSRLETVFVVMQLPDSNRLALDWHVSR